MTGVRERTREVIRAELAQAAFDVCVVRGFDEVTTDELAQGIGVSRATFFRYFRSKEDAIVTAARSTRLEFGESLLALDRRDGEPALQAVRRILKPTIEAERADPERFRARHRMIAASPSLRARLASDHADKRRGLTEALTELIGDPATAVTVAMASMAAIDLGWSLWDADPDADLGQAMDRAFDLITRVGAVTL